LTQISIRVNFLIIASLVILAAAASFLIIAIDVYGSVVIVPPGIQTNLLEDEVVLTFNATYWNKTQALLNGSVLHADVMDEIIKMINEDLRGENALSSLEEETEEQELESNDNGGGGDGGNGGGNDNNDEVNTRDEEPIIPMPNPGFPPPDVRNPNPPSEPPDTDVPTPSVNRTYCYPEAVECLKNESAT
jgi:hypothetical protein